SAMNKELIENLQNQIRLYNSLELENLNHEERDVFEKIMAVSKDSLAMLKGMFNFSMVQQDEQSKINIQEVITKATEFCKYGLPESIEIKMDDIDKDFQLTLPASQFIGVLIHLIMNAREAIELSGVIEISCEKLVLNINQKSKIMGPWIPGKYYRISIKDNGKGIKEEQINRIFEPLFSTGQGNLPSGMGLRTLKNFIEDMNGGIEVQPQWLIGSTFNLYLPLNFEDTFKKEILLMISDGVKRESLREVLEENMTHNISAITQLEDACDLLKESSNKIDLIILEEDFFNRGLSEDCKKILYGKRVLLLGSDQSKMQEYLSMEPEKLIVHELQQGNEQLLKRIGGLLEPTNLSPLDIKTDIPKEQLFFPDRALELLEGNQDLHQTICRDFIIDYGQAVSQIKELLKAKDWEKSRLIVHSIKGLAGLVGSQELQEAARSFEDVLKNQNAPRLNEEFQGFSGILSKVLKEIDQYLEFNDFSENNFSKKEILKILPSELLLEVVEPLRKHLELWEYNESLEVVEDLMNRSKDGEFIESLVPLLERVKQFNFEAALEYLELPEE
ncbi:MAG: ATP-binding protein, partial [Spirochaetaceae bacterium]|nr:ATP-binding protein [Spirochaetaceae bacterium]